MNFRVLMVHDFSAMVPGVEVHRYPYFDRSNTGVQVCALHPAEGAGLHSGRRLLVVILVTISQKLFRQLE